MPVVGRRDNHGIDIGPRQNFAVIARREDIVAEDFFGAR